MNVWKRSLMRSIGKTITGVALMAEAGQGAPLSDYPIQPVDHSQVRIGSGFWGQRIATNHQRTVWTCFDQCEKTGRIENFANAANQVKRKFKGIPYNDSDVFKVVEGAAYILAQHEDPKLDNYLDQLIDLIARAQEPDGYLYTAYTLKANHAIMGSKPWINEMTQEKGRDSHELYNTGHLYEAAVAHYRATGKRTLLDVAIRSADHVDRVFGPDRLKLPPGHQVIELALVKLFRATGERRYLDLSRFFLDARGNPEIRSKHTWADDVYFANHKPVVEQREAVGHAVRSTYMYAGMADIAAIMDDDAYREAVDALWESIVHRKMALTGGLGAVHKTESLGPDYVIPHDAYNETCAAIGLAYFAHRMFLLHGDAGYMDVLERILYNGSISGVSLEGDHFFYPNPLYTNGRDRFNHGKNSRQPWFSTSCCPVNIVRFVPSMPGYMYAVSKGALWANLFAQGEARVEVDGTRIALRQITDYPWKGDVALDIAPERPTRFALRVRIPGWARNEPVPGGLYRYVGDAPGDVVLKVNGEPVEFRMDRGYAVVDREWQRGDRVALSLPMEPRRVVARDEVAAARGQVAVEYGPLVYCAEAVDNAEMPIEAYHLDGDAELTAQFKPSLLNGAVKISAEVKGLKQPLTLVPYSLWNNRAEGAMTVWLPTEPKVASEHTFSMAARAMTSASRNEKHTAALNDGLQPRNSDDHDIPRFTWWDQKGGKAWVQYELLEPVEVGAAQVYWFDDRPRGGGCRVPASWRLLYRDGAAWREVEQSSGYGVEPDQFNRVEFRPIPVTQLRLEVQMQEGFSAGILEWKVE